MTTRKFTAVSIAIGLLLSLLALLTFSSTATATTSVTAKAPSTAKMAAAASATYDEQAALGCWSPYQLLKDPYDLIGPSGYKRSDIGQLRMSFKEVPGKNWYCAIVQSGETTLGVGKPMYVMIGFYRPGSSTVAWPMVEGSHFDSGFYARQAGGLWVQVPDGWCLAYKGSIKWNGNFFTRTHKTGICYAA
jgi:hypothetical protein